MDSDGKKNININVIDSVDLRRQYEQQIQSMQNHFQEETENKDRKIKLLELLIGILGVITALLGVLDAYSAFFIPSDTNFDGLESTNLNGSYYSYIFSDFSQENLTSNRFEFLPDVHATDNNVYKDGFSLSCMSADKGKIIFNLGNGYHIFKCDIVVRDHLKASLKNHEARYYFYVDDVNTELKTYQYSDLQTFQTAPDHVEIDLTGKKQLIIQGEAYSEIFAFVNFTFE